MSTMTGEQSVRRALNTLLHRFEQARALDWPLTARDADTLIALARKQIRLAEQHLDAGNPVVAQAAVSVGYSALITLGSLYELETMEH